MIDIVRSAFDLGKSCTGIAVFKENALLFHDKRSFKGANSAVMFIEFTKVLDNLDTAMRMAGSHIELFTFEAAEHQQGKAREAYFVLSTALCVFAYRHNAKAAKVYSTTIKKIVTGHGSASKEEMVEAINKRYGLRLSSEKKSADHNVADAIGVGLAAQALIDSGKLELL